MNNSDNSNDDLMQMNLAIVVLRNLLKKFQLKESEVSGQAIKIMGDTFIRYSQKSDQLIDVLRLETPNYNLFEVLRIRHYEVKVHTPFIAHLLNPLASHNQQRLFFDLFFNHIYKDECLASDVTHVSTVVERRNSFGQIDIQIDFRANGRRKSLVIENKIYHHDGDAQLFRYYQFLSSTGRLLDEDILLLYLTLDGKQPSRQSLGAVPNSCLKTISYRVDIANWISAALELLNHNSLYYTLVQYLKTIHTL